MTGIERIAAERQRQIDVEGWTAEHDQQHLNSDLVLAALTYAAEATSALDLQERLGAHYWPWNPDWWKPSDDPIRNLEKAGALVAAEIDRLLAESPEVPT